SATELARLIEATQPGLREDVLSAVELGKPGSDPQYDSATFRSLLQGSVARRLGGVRIADALPGTLIRGWLMDAATARAACLILLAIPALGFGPSLVRAMAPLAGVQRVSTFHIEFVQPADLSKAVPQGDPVDIVVRVTGGKPERVELETDTKGGRADKSLM